ncbi:MAG: hypothetical protein EA396_13105 [Anaerolineaceae bacterium]|nr:MAG: hypothetical protein EA396_13105 [Anaerolineaceae bacterium]
MTENRVQRPSNTLPYDDAQSLQNFANLLTGHMAYYGYELIEMPIIEDADLFLTKAGDNVAERLFTFERNGHVLTLRPEFTAAAAHRYITGDQTGAARWQFKGAIFADYPDDKDRHSQRYSVGAELIGMAGAMAEAEIIAMAVRGIEQAGITDWQLVIGHVGLTRQLLARYGLDPRTQRHILSARNDLKRGDDDAKAALMARLDQYLWQTPQQADDDAITQTGTQSMLDVLLNTSRASATMGGRTRHDIARRLLRKRQQAAQKHQIDDALHFLQRWMAINAPVDAGIATIKQEIGDDQHGSVIFAEWLTMLDLLSAAGIDRQRIVIQPDLARTWDYYTGVVFDLRGADGVTLAGGGRYDELPRLIGAENDVPAVGFAYRMEAIIAGAGNLADDQPVHRLLYDDATGADAMRWAMALRGHGVHLILTPERDDSPFMRVDESGAIHHDGQTFTLTQIDTLAEILDGS